LEGPSMIKAVGNIKGKKLLDVGCGAGVHIKKYVEKGAKCSGLDISKTLIELAKKRCPKSEFKVGSMSNMSYPKGSFDIVTSSLAIHYVDDLKKVFKEINRVLGKGGLFYYSSDSLVYLVSDAYKDSNYKIKGVCEFVDRRTGKTIVVGNPGDEGPKEWDMLPGMRVRTFRKPFRVQLKALVDSGFELIDVMDCKPSLGFKKHDAEEYKFVSKVPIFSIFKARKLK